MVLPTFSFTSDPPVIPPAGVNPSIFTWYYHGIIMVLHGIVSVDAMRCRCHDGSTAMRCDAMSLTPHQRCDAMRYLHSATAQRRRCDAMPMCDVSDVLPHAATPARCDVDAMSQIPCWQVGRESFGWAVSCVNLVLAGRRPAGQPGDAMPMRCPHACRCQAMRW